MASEATGRVNWSRAETLAAIHLYLQLPFGQLHARTPKIIDLAAWIGRTPGAVALKLVNLASLDEGIRASGRAGMGNVSTLDRTLWRELQADWDELTLAAAAEYARFAAAHGVQADADLLATAALAWEGRTRSATVEVRVNQARFRRTVLTSYGNTCCISGLQHDRLVIASHISPWSEDAKNRLNPHNGLCLSALHDRAYDQGLITVMPDYTVRVSASLRDHADDRFMADALLAFDRRPILLPERFLPGREFLAGHARRFGFMP